MHPSATPCLQSCFDVRIWGWLKDSLRLMNQEIRLENWSCLGSNEDYQFFFSGLSKEFRRYNSVGSVQKKKRKIPLDFKNQVPTRRRSVSCRDYSQASGIDLDGLERASSEHDIRSQCQNFSWIVIAVFALLLLLLFCCCCWCRCWRLRLPRYRVQNTICRRNIVTSQFQLY